MFDKIDVTDIVRDHLRTMRGVGEGRTSSGDVLLFFGLPLGLGTVTAVTGVQVGRDAANLLVNALAILAGLLLNILVLIHGLLRRYAGPEGNPMARALLKELYANIAYAIFVAVFSLLPLLASGFTMAPRASAAVSGASFFLLGNFLLTLLMILKRVHALLAREFEHPAGVK